MQTNYKIERGDIYWIKPSDFERGGENTIRSDRPAIIVSNNDINDYGFNYEIVFLTTKPKRDRNTHVTIRSAKTTSTALCEQVTTVSAEQIGAFVGQCTPEEMDMVDACILISLGLKEPAAGYTTMVEPEPEEYEEEPDEEDALYETIQELQEALIKAKAEADTIRKMYNELLERTLKG